MSNLFSPPAVKQPFPPGFQVIPGQPNAAVNPDTGSILWRSGDGQRISPSPQTQQGIPATDEARPLAERLQDRVRRSLQVLDASLRGEIEAAKHGEPAPETGDGGVTP